MELPEVKDLVLEFDERGVLSVTFNRPEVRNAMRMSMVAEIESVFDAIAEDRSVRVVLIKGAGGHFCAGGDIKDMAAGRAAKTEEGQPDAMAVTNRRFGDMILKLDRAPQAVVAQLEGAVLGGGFGLACVADIAIAQADAKFGLPETSLGVPPAQIAPFVVRRLGLSQARRLAVTGGRFNGEQAAEIGLVHRVCPDAPSLAAAVDEAINRILGCAPGAVAVTKRIMLDVGAVDIEKLLDRAAGYFAEAARGPEGIEGMTAFIQKRPPKWRP